MPTVYLETTIPSYLAAFPSRDLIAYEMDFLVTWNCQHIANGEIIRRLVKANTELKRFTPLIVTPEELLIIPGEEEV